MLLKWSSAAAVLCIMLLFWVPYQSEGSTDLESLIGEIFAPNNSCTCVPYYRCNDTDTINSTAEINDNNSNRGNGTSTPCENSLDVCCKANRIKEPTPEEKLIEEVFRTNNTGNSHNTSCTCVPYYLCNKNNSNGIDLRDNGTATCDNYLHICCEDKNRVVVVDSVTEATAPPRRSNKTSSCTCVPYYLCAPENAGDIGIDGVGIIDIRENDEATCESYLEVCCKNNQTVEVPVRIPPPPSKKKGCGHRNPDGIGFKINDIDFEAQYGEFPWMAAVLRKEEVDGADLNVYQCGGALIHPQVVMTAAHCVDSMGLPTYRLKIRAGEWDTQTTNELYPFQDRDISSFVLHPQYKKARLYNDIALLFLTTPVTIEENVNVVCLPSQNEIIESDKCFASGWGKNIFGKKGKYQVIMKKVELPMVMRDRCQENLRNKTKLGRYFKLHESFVCAGGVSGRDTCKGDGGSPLVCPIRGHEGEQRYAQVGIVSWGSGCGEASVPGVYTNVALYRDWIDEQMKLKHLEIDSYQFMDHSLVDIH